MASILNKSEFWENHTKSEIQEYIISHFNGLTYKGTLGGSNSSYGHISSLPSASFENLGYAYLVAVNGTYQNISSKVGDLIACIQTGTSSYGWKNLINMGDKLNSSNPTGTGSLSLNRKSGSSTGTNSTSVGTDGIANATNSFVEGDSNMASGRNSHAAGRNTRATRADQFVIGHYNATDPLGSNGTQFGRYAMIVGNGNDTDSSNAMSVGWDGNLYLQGDLYTGCEPDGDMGGSLNESLMNIRTDFEDELDEKISWKQNFERNTVWNIEGSYGTYPRLMKWTDDTIYIFLDDRYRIMRGDVIDSSGSYFAKKAVESDSENGITITEIANAFPIKYFDRIVVFFRCHGTYNGNPYYSIRAKLSNVGGTFDADSRSNILWDTIMTNDTNDVSYWEPFSLGCDNNGLHYVFYSTIKHIPNSNATDYQEITRLEYDVVIDDLDEVYCVRRVGDPVTVINGYDCINLDNEPNHSSRPGMVSISKLKSGGFIGVVENSVNLTASMPRALCIQYFYLHNITDTLPTTDVPEDSMPKNIFLQNEGLHRGAPYVTTLNDGRVAISFMSDVEYKGIHRTNSSICNKVVDLYISKIPISEGTDLIDNLFVKQNFFEFGYSQWGCWPSVQNINGVLYKAFTFGVNTSATTATRYGNVIVADRHPYDVTTCIPTSNNALILTTMTDDIQIGQRGYHSVSEPGGLASGEHSHAEGVGTTASGEFSHAEGMGTTASGQASHVEGGWEGGNSASGDCSHAEGDGTTASGYASHAEGSGTASGNYSHAEGGGTTASGDYSHAEGYNNTASVDYSHAEGDGTTASGTCSHAEGDGTTASGNYSHAEGSGTIASANYSHAEGLFTTAAGAYSHAEGNSLHKVSQETLAKNNNGIIDDWENSKFALAKGTASHIEGDNCLALGTYSHAEGVGTTASGNTSHAEGMGTTASGNYSHTEGSGTTASGNYSHAEGSGTASGTYSHAEGRGTTASGAYSHAEGNNTQTSNYGEYAGGNYNVTNHVNNTLGNEGNTVHSIGVGKSGSGNAKNGIEIMQNGLIFIIGVGGYNGKNPSRTRSLQYVLQTLGISIDWTTLGYTS